MDDSSPAKVLNEGQGANRYKVLIVATQLLIDLVYQQRLSSHVYSPSSSFCYASTKALALA